jgi:hypothetical protein
MDVLEQELELGHAASSGYSRHRQPSLAGVLFPLPTAAKGAVNQIF